MELPIPSHLKELLDIDCKKSNETKLYASLKCCKEEIFSIEKSINDCICIIKVVCQKCKKEIILFDSREHGWDGYVCQLFKQEPIEPFSDVKCKKCAKNSFKVSVFIRSQGKQDFIEEACQEHIEEAGRVFTESEWVNAFSEIIVDLECRCCNKKQNLITFETM